MTSPSAAQPVPSGWLGAVGPDGFRRVHVSLLSGSGAAGSWARVLLALAMGAPLFAFGIAGHPFALPLVAVVFPVAPLLLGLAGATWLSPDAVRSRLLFTSVTVRWDEVAEVQLRPRRCRIVLVLHDGTWCECASLASWDATERGRIGGALVDEAWRHGVKVATDHAGRVDWALVPMLDALALTPRFPRLRLRDRR